MESKIPNSVRVVEDFLQSLFVARDLKVALKSLSESFLIGSAGPQQMTVAQLRDALRPGAGKLGELSFRSLETFQNENGSRVVSRWHIEASWEARRKRGGTPARIVFGGLSIWSVGEDGRLFRVWFERRTWEALNAWLRRIAGREPGAVASAPGKGSLLALRVPPTRGEIHDQG